jgi:hypothetical protein
MSCRTATLFILDSMFDGYWSGVIFHLSFDSFHLSVTKSPQ